MNKKIRYGSNNLTVNFVVNLMKQCLRKARKEIRTRKSSENKVVSLYPEKSSNGKVLLSYIIDGFLFDADVPIPKTHTNIWQSMKMAEIFVELGYEVEVIHYNNNRYIPEGDYTFFVDVRHNMQRLSPILNNDCIKIMHIDSANILFHNAAEANRLLQLQQRRGITLPPQRFEIPNRGIEYADYATTTGNDFTVDTFKYANMRIYKLPSPCGIIADLPKRDWGKCRKNFLWFSSSGLVHKGLDLALEAFKGMYDFHLTVCAPLDQDKDFVKAYHKELYETDNIKAVGWVNIDGNQFIDITSKCGAILHLSCSEGGAPSIKVCMHTGLIPVVSYESGVDVEPFGFMLRDCSIDNLKKIVSYIANLSEDKLQKRSYNAWEFAKSNYSRENFANEYRKVLLDIIGKEKSKKKET
jgi:glycosyltransferase involved in cell wall biosynthesis